MFLSVSVRECPWLKSFYFVVLVDFVAKKKNHFRAV